MLDKENQVIDHQYYQLLPHHDGHGHTIERYRFGEEAPPVGFPLWSIKNIEESDRQIFVTDCPFLATQLAEPNEIAHEKPLVIVANGVLESGYSEKNFRFNVARYNYNELSSVGRNVFTGRDAVGIAHHLGLNEIPLKSCLVHFFLEGDWMGPSRFWSKFWLCVTTSSSKVVLHLL